MHKPADPGAIELSRDLGFFAVFATATGTMIGAGIFVLPGVAAANAGPAAALSFLFAGIIAGLAALSVCELATAMPKAGGPYYFVSRAMGPLVGAVVGLGAWLALILKGAFALAGLGQYVLFFVPAPVLVSASLAGLALMAINYMGARVTGGVQNFIVVLLLAILAWFVGRGVFAVEADVLRPLVPFGWTAVASTTGLVFISYLGIVKAAAVSEEVRDPGRTIPRAILTSVALVTMLYVGVMVVVTGVLPIPGIDTLAAPLADAGTIFLGAAGGAVVAVGGLLATISTGNAAILSSSRYPFAMARDALMTPWFSRIDPRFRTPARSIVVTGGTMIVLVLLFDVEALAKLGGVFGILVFALVNVAVLILRRLSPEWYRPSFRAPLYPLLQIVGAIAAVALIPQMGLLSQAAAAGFILLGVGWYYAHRKRYGADRIEPSYGLIDTFVRVRQLQALEQKRRSYDELPREREQLTGSVVVELLPSKPNRHLLNVAAALARRYECPVDGIVITPVPDQTPLGGATARAHDRFEARVRRRLAEAGVELRFHNVLARDRARALLNFVGDDTHAVLIDWHDKFRRITLPGNPVDRVLRTCPARVVVLKYRGIEKYERILVATAGGPYASAEVEVADAVAAGTGARITFVMVVPPDASVARHQYARDYLEELRKLAHVEADTVVVPGEDIAETLVNAARRFDLVVLGASREPNYQRIFGRVPEIVAAETERSVLITQDPGFQQIWSRRFRILLKRLRYGRVDELPIPPRAPD